MTELFTTAQIATLRAEYSKIGSIEPSWESYRKMIDLLDQMSQEQLLQVRDARIPWLWRLAMNRIGH